MIRNLSVIGALALSAGAASAAFQGLDVREGKTLSAAAQLLYPAGARTFNLYGIFDGDSSDDIRNTVLSAGQPDDVTGWGIDTVNNPGATFFQTGAPFGGDTAPSSGFFGFDATLEFDTFVSVGVKDSLGGDETNPDPDFDMGVDTILGGWANGNPPSLQGDPTDNGGVFETFLAQVTILGLDPGAQLGSSLGFNEQNGTWQFATGVLTGSFTIFRQGDLGGGETPAIALDIEFVPVPAPGAVATLGVAGLLGLRRRRRA